MVLKGFDIGNDFLTGTWLQPVSIPEIKARNLFIDMLRLDQVHPMISGNKWLKLEGWLEKYDQQSNAGIMTAGGPWSNHLHACAYACLLNNIPMKAIIKGHPEKGNEMIEDLRKWNVSVEFVNRQQFYDHRHWQTLAQQQNWLWIPMGGDGEEGEKGVTRWMNALPLPGYDYIITAVGTATTLAGIARSNLSFRHLWGFDPGTRDTLLDQKVQELEMELPEKEIKLIRLKNKFGKLAPELADFMRDWKNKTGTDLDFVYTAPMCNAFLEMTGNGSFENKSKVLIVHTGGLQGNRSQPLLLKGNRDETGLTY